MKVDCTYIVVSVPIPIADTHIDQGMLLVTVETDTGLRGVGLARESSRAGRAAAAVITDDIAPLLTGLPEVAAPPHVWQVAIDEAPRLNYRTPVGVTAGAGSAVDQALWDIWGKVLGRPVFQLLGGCHDAVEVYAACGLNLYTPEQEAEAVRQHLARGFRAFKLQGTAPAPDRDVRRDAGRVRRLREVAGETATIMLDGRNSYSLREAIELGKLVADCDLTFFDEPLYANDPAAMLRLVQSCPGLRLAARSRGGNIWDNRDLVTSGAVAVLATNVLDQGGFTQCQKVAHLAEAHQLPLVTGGAFHLQNSHLIAAVTNGWMTEYHTVMASLSEQIFVDPVRPVDGVLHLTDKPGLGLLLNDDAVAEAAARASRLP